MARIPKFIEGAAFGILNDIIAGFHNDNGYAQPNRYEILILPPPKLGGGNQESLTSFLERKSDIRQISLRAQNVTMPGRNLSTAQEGNVYGPDREIVEGVTYADEISVQFQASSGLDERVFFENWQKQAFDENTWNLGYYEDYTGEMHVYLLDRQDKRRYGLKMWDVFPKTITAASLNGAQATEILKTNVSFSFRYWTNLDQKQQGPSDIMGRIFETVANSAERNISRNIPRVLTRL